MPLPNRELANSDSEALSVFNIEQLEQELARRKRKRAETDILTPSSSTSSQAPGASRNTAIKLEDSDSEEESHIPSQNVQDVQVKNESSSEAGPVSSAPASAPPPSAPPSGRSTRKRGPKRPPPALYKAHIKSLADGGTARVAFSTSDVDNTVIKRIMKCLDRANHPGTPEAEAKAALHIASRLMGQYNVSQAEVLAHESADTKMQFGGQSVVMLQRTDGDKSRPVRHYGYVDYICAAMCTFFDCKHYSTAKASRLELTFYGIAENTVVAATSFEMAYNLITEWARPYKGVGKKNSYCLGASKELERMAKKEKAAEEARAKKAEEDALAAREKQEEIDRQAEIDRLAPLPTVHILGEGGSPNPSPGADSGEIDGEDAAVPDQARSPTPPSLPEMIDVCNSDSDGMDESDDDSDYIEPDFTVEDEDVIDLTGDIDEEINMHIKPEPQPMSPSPGPAWYPSQASTADLTEEAPMSAPSEVGLDPNKSSEAVESKWASHMQLMTFRTNATQVAEEYLKEKGVKLTAGRSRSHNIHDWTAYDQGVKDGKTIDVHRRRLKQDSSIVDDNGEEYGVPDV